MANKDDVRINQSNQAHAFTLADKAGADKTFAPLVTELVEAGEKKKGAPIRLMLKMAEIYGGGDTTKGWLYMREEFPVLGTEESKGHNNPETFDVLTTDEKTGDTKTKSANFYTEFFARTELGKQWAFVKGQCEIALSRDPAKAEPAYKQMGRPALEAMKKKYQNRLSQGRKDIRQALGCLQQLDRLSEYQGRVSFEYNMDDNGDIANSPYPINLIDETVKLKGTPLAVTDLLRMKVREAAAVAGEKGNLYDALLATIARGKKDDAASKVPQIISTDLLVTFWDRIAVYLDTETDEGEMNFGETVAMQKKKGSDDSVLTFARAFRAMRKLYPSFSARIERLEAKEIKAQEEAAAAEEKAA